MITASPIPMIPQEHVQNFYNFRFIERILKIVFERDKANPILMMSEQGNCMQSRKRLDTSNLSWKHNIVLQLREVQEQLAYLTDLQARLMKAGRRKKKKEGLGAGKGGSKKDGEG